MFELNSINETVKPKAVEVLNNWKEEDLLTKAKLLFEEKHFGLAIDFFAYHYLKSYKNGTLLLPQNREKHFHAKQQCVDAATQLYKKQFPAPLSKKELGDPFTSAVSYHLDHRIYANEEEVFRKQSQKKIALSKGAKVNNISYFDIEPAYHPKEIKKSSVNFPYNVLQAQGQRTNMEDLYIVDSFEVANIAKIDLYGVFDGHGGSICANFVKGNIVKYLKNQMNANPSLKDIDLQNSIKLGCVHLDDDWISSDNYIHDMSGTTACLTLVVHDLRSKSAAIWSVNVGDSRAVLAANQNTFQLTTDAKPKSTPTKENSKGFAYGVIKRGGTILYNRVNGTLATARAFGNRIGGQKTKLMGVSARPEVNKWEFPKDQNSYIYIASDGIWNNIDSEEVVSLTNKSLSLENRTKIILNAALDRGSTDNCTLLTIQLSHQ